MQDEAQNVHGEVAIDENPHVSEPIYTAKWTLEYGPHTLYIREFRSIICIEVIDYEAGEVKAHADLQFRMGHPEA